MPAYGLSGYGLGPYGVGAGGGGNSFPPVVFECALTTDPGSLTPTWVDLTDYVIEFEIARGRQFELDRFEAGTMRLLLDNADRRFDAYYTAGPYYGNLLPGRRWRVRVVDSAATYYLYDGYTEGWPRHRQGPDYSEVEITCTDGFAVLAQALLPAGTYPSELASASVTRMLDAISWPTDRRSISTARSSVQARTVADTDETYTLTGLQDATEAEDGQLFMDGQGRVVFQDRWGRLRAPYITSQVTFTDNPTNPTSGATEVIYEGSDPSYDWVRVFNEIKGTATGGVTQTATDSTSQIRYLRRTLSETGLLVTTDGEVLTRCQARLRRYKAPALRYEQIDVDVRNCGNANAVALLLGREISDRVTIVENPPEHPVGTDQQLSSDHHVEHIRHRGSMRDMAWDVSFLVSPADSQQFWVLDTSALGVTTALAY